MKKQLILLFLLTGFAQIVFSQSDSLKPAYLRFPTVPPFQLLKTDSTTMLTKNDLQKNRPVMIMYFSPDCDHCQKQMDDLMKDFEPFRNIQLVMATVQPLEMLRSFYEKYALAKYENILVGRDIKYILPPFYQMRNLPYMALYDRKGNLITTYEGNVKPATLLKSFRKK